MSENLVSLLKQGRREFAKSPLFGTKDGQSWRWITYLQFDQRVEQAAAHLARLGVGRGDRVAIVGDWCVEWAEVAHAACRRRASFVLVPARLSLAEWLSIFRDCGAKLAFATERLHYDALETSRFESVGVERVIGLALPADHPDSYSRWLADAPSMVLNEGIPNPDDIASRIYARTDSERPRGVGLSHRTLCQASNSISQPSHSIRRTLGSILSLRRLFASAAVFSAGIAAWLTPALAQAQYVVHSPYLQHPERNIELVLDTADFWARAKDEINGGYYNYVDDAGNPVFPGESWWNTEQCGQKFDFHLRTVFGQSRMAYAFSKAFMLTGNIDYLEHAEHALTFMYRTGWDQEHGGWFFTTNERGELAPWQPCDGWNPNTWKWTFDQLYPLLGIAAMSEARLDASHDLRGEQSGSSLHWGWLMTGTQLLEDRLWDSRPGYLGYYENADLDWGNPRGKGFTGAADAITTHAESLYLQTQSAAYKQRLLQLADILAQRLTPTIGLDETLFGFVEAFDNDWQIDAGNGGGFVGHLMKAAWCLARAYLVEPRAEYREAAMTIIREVWNNGGYDHEHGGSFQDSDWTTGAILQGKNFWNVEQGFTGGISNYYIADNAADRDLNLQLADESLDFFMTSLRDPKDGVPYTSTENDGTPADTQKGHLWKAGYHDAEMGYLAYLYGNLYYKKEPVSLYYYLEPRAQPHVIQLNPIAIEQGALVISAVRLNGVEYRHFDAESRSLTLLPGKAGVFKVTFSPSPGCKATEAQR